MPLDIHTWFNLSYASYFVMPRSVLQAMPEEWQYRFTALVDQLNDTLDWGACHKHYTVLLRGEKGVFIRDPLRNYRHPPAIAQRKPPEGGDPDAGLG
jgi:hypothetical protein